MGPPKGHETPQRDIGPPPPQKRDVEPAPKGTKGTGGDMGPPKGYGTSPNRALRDKRGHETPKGTWDLPQRDVGHPKGT